MTGLEVLEVRTRADRAKFLATHANVFAGQPLAIRPLDYDLLHAIDPARSGFLKANASAAWVALRDGKPVGRIMAVDNAEYRQRYDASAGHFGYLQFIDDRAVLEALVAPASAWLRSRGIGKVIGPFSPSINHETGLLIEGFDSAPAYLMNYSAPYAGPALEAIGFTKAMDLFSFTCNTGADTQPAPLRQLVERTLASGRYSVRNLDFSRYRQDIDLLVDVYNDGWSGNWGATPMSPAEARDLGAALLPLVRPEWISFVEAEGQTIAVALQMPDANEAARDLDGRLLPLGWLKLLYRMRRPAVSNSRLLMLGVRKAWQGRSAGPIAALMLIQSSLAAASRHGIKTAEVGWILETNQAILSVVDKFAITGRKTYRVYEKAI